MDTEHTVIYGGAGCGKTTTLKNESENLPDDEKLLILSFSRKAAAEIGSRIDGAECRTVHSVSLQILTALGSVSTESVTSAENMADFNRTSCWDVVFEPQKPNTDLQKLTAECMAVYDHSRSNGCSIVDSVEQTDSFHIAGFVRAFVSDYEAYLKAHFLIDFHTMLTNASTADPKLFDLCDNLMVDEAQDLSPLQWTVIHKIAAHCKRVFICGDDDQTIFDWAGATYSGMVEWERRYKAKRVVLDTTWRVPANSFNLANHLIMQVEGRVPKDITPHKKVGLLEVYNGTGALSKLTMNDDALVLGRTNATLKRLSKGLIERGIAFKSSRGVNNPISSRIFANMVEFEEFCSRSRDTLSNQAADAIKEQFGADNPHSYHGKELHPFWWRSAPDEDLKQLASMALASNTEYLSFFSDTKITLSTIHSQKGGEADYVYLDTSIGKKIAKSDRLDPHSEARVWYVGLTRVKKAMIIMRHVGEESLFLAKTLNEHAPRPLMPPP